METRSFRALSLCACLCLALSACGGVSLWPFGGKKTSARGGPPTDAIEYRCDSGGFHVRYADGGAWLIYPDREVFLDRAGSDAGRRYSNGVATLEINGNEAKLVERSVSVNGCKAVGK